MKAKSLAYLRLNSSRILIFEIKIAKSSCETPLSSRQLNFLQVGEERIFYLAN